MKYIDADKLIRQEIKRLKEENRNIRCQHNEKYCIGYDDAFNDLLSFIDSLQQEQPVEVDLENEIETWIPAHIKGEHESRDTITEWAKIVARHFAKWSAEQFEKNRLAHCDKLTKEEYDLETDFATEIIEKEHRQPTFTDAINYGMRVMKEYLMNEAVEGFFTKSIDGDVVFAESTALDVDPKSVKVGDKVKLIVIKED